MLKKAAAKKKRWITIPIVGVLTTTILAGVLYNTSETVSARVSLPGIEQITQGNDNSDPFTILEIVPSYDQAKIGYLVQGEEPGYWDAERGVLALADMGSAAERTHRYDPARTTDPFAHFSHLDGLAFDYEGKLVESDAGERHFTTYGSFVLKSETKDKDYDYLDARLDSSAFKVVYTYDEGLKAEQDFKDGLITEAERDKIKARTLAEILKQVNTETTGEIYDDEIIYTFSQPDTYGFKPVFTKVSDAPAGESYPFNATNAPADTYDWNFYKANIINFNKVEDSDNPGNYEYIIDTNLEQFLPVYVDLDGLDGITYGLDYIGYTHNNGTNWFYYDIDSNTDYDLSNPDSLKEIYEAYFNESTGAYISNPEAEFCYMQEYVSYENVQGVELGDLYYISKIDADTRGFVKYDTIDKNLRIIAGQDATQYGLSSSDNDHVFYYRENTGAGEYIYVDNNASPDDQGTHNFVSDYTQDAVETFSYDDGIVNKELFKKYVLDRDAGVQCENTVVDVVTKLYKDVEVSDVEAADLIYIQGIGIVGTPADMSTEVAKAIVDSVKSNKAIVIEAEALFDNATGCTNLQTLAVTLTQDSLADGNIDQYIADWGTLDVESRNKFGNYTKRTVFVTPSTDTTYVDVICDTDSDGKLLFTKTITGADNLAGYSEAVTDINNEIFYLKVAYGDPGYLSYGFNDKISYSTIFRHILNYGKRRVTTKDTYNILDIEPFYSQVYEDKKSLFGTQFRDRDGTYNVANDFVTKAKRDIFDSTWFKNNVCEKNRSITLNVKGMSTREFVGNIADLNSSYDMIYIGLDTMYMNTKRGNSTGWNVYEKSTNTVYNDNRMDKLVYSHVGDKMNFSTGNDAKASSTDTYRTGGNDLTYEKLKDLETYVEAGYAVLLSNDFFTYKNDGSIDSINTVKVDENSYMYDFIKICLYGVKYLDKDGNIQSVDINKAIREHDYSHGYMGKNVNIVRDFDKEQKYSRVTDNTLSFGKSFDTNRVDFVNYLNIQKLEIVEIKRPLEYYNPQDNTVSHYLTSRNGNYYLDYEVELVNKAAVGSPSYDCKLYLDVNADGRFSEYEVQQLNDIVTSYGANANKTDGKFTLSTGTRYNISFAVPDDFKGFLSWKLEFIENDRISSTGEDLVKTSIVGYSAVPDNSSNRTTIKVLQITSGSDLSTNLDLTSDSMKKLYEGVHDFKIEVQKISAQQFVNNNSPYKKANQTRLQYLEDYDMVVMGFADVYTLPGTGTNTYEATYALREYILSGRSMLFTHDLNSPHVNYDNENNNGKNEWGGFLNQYIRELQGMDRYGATKANVQDLINHVSATTGTEYESRYDNDADNDVWGNKNKKVSNNRFNLSAAKNSASYVDKYGLIYGQFNKYRNGNQLGDVSKESLRSQSQNESYNQGNKKPINNAENNFASAKVSMINEGQITDYPYHIGESLTVATTHPQYFQLNLDTDSKDDNINDDIVVWYAIDGYGDGNNIGAYSSYYTMDHNDARNNYYIYNKGNITYTGSGHAEIQETNLDERKLFVNTLVAAYSAGKHPPKITYKESGWNQSANINAIYEPYDVNLDSESSDAEGGALENTITVNFKATNSNLMDSRESHTNEDGTVTYTFKKINVLYYAEDRNGQYKFGDINVRKIDDADIELYMVADSTGNVFDKPVLIDPSKGESIHMLENNAIYTAKIKNSYFLRTTGSPDGKSLELASHSGALYIRASLGEMKDTIDPNNPNVIKDMPSTESFNELRVNYTELYELK